MKTVKYLIFIATIIAIGCGGSTAFRSGKTYFYQHKDYAQAEDAFRQAIQDEPDNWEAYSYLAQSLARQEKYDEARGYFVTAREKAPDDEKKMIVKETQRTFFVDHAKRGITALNTDNFEEAVYQFEMATSVYDEDPVGWVNLGVSYSNMAPTAEVPEPEVKAMEAFQRSVDVDPTYVEGWRNLGISYRNAGDFAKAQEAFEKVVELAPEDVDGLLSLGDVSFNIEDYDKALDSYQKAADLEPENYDLQFSLGAAYFNRERYAEAGQAFQKAAAGAMGTDAGLYEDALYRLGFSYVKTENYEAAISTLSTLIAVSDKPEYHELLGTAYTKAGQTDAAVKEFQKAKEMRGE
jgi:tetratricopeptide (TPR) repeat protein